MVNHVKARRYHMSNSLYTIPDAHAIIGTQRTRAKNSANQGMLLLQQGMASSRARLCRILRWLWLDIQSGRDTGQLPEVPRLT
jgi:hypothetical protein